MDEPENNVFYLGVDPSLNSTGIVCLDYEYNILVAETFRMNPDCDTTDIKQYLGYAYGLERITEILMENIILPDYNVFFEIAVEAPLESMKGRKAGQLYRWNCLVTDLFVNSNSWAPFRAELVKDGNEYDIEDLVIKPDYNQFGSKTHMVNPKTLKKETAGKGTASKDEMMYAVKHKYNIDFSEEKGASDLTDAYALARYAARQYYKRFEKAT